jgi:hypothetical protein
VGYNSTQRLLKSRLPIIIESEPHIFGKKLSSHYAIVACTEWLLEGTTESHHVIADSAFAASRSIEQFAGINNSVVTMSINNSTTSGFGSVYQFIQQKLPKGRSCLYAAGNSIIQIRKSGKYVSVITSTGFKLVGEVAE